MSDTAIWVEGLGKQYRLGAAQEGYATLRDQIRKWTSLRGMMKWWANRSEASPLFWALKDVSFEVKRGEVVGVIGRNGAGKSTLLKILSRITEPTEGAADIHGRVGSLLEVGTGFHPELTGRENVFLNGAILGMKRAEIVRKFDEIVAFAELDKFIDTPVKHYSSGMYMRLAFAVAAHLEPEILVVDEVLAVGDAEFQKKCLGKMSEVARGGRTVLFVSHNIAAIEALTRRCLYLEAGQVVLYAETRSAAAAYQAKSQLLGEAPQLGDWLDRKKSPGVEITCFECLDRDGNQCSLFAPREPIRVRLRIRFLELTTADIGIVVETANQQPLFTSHLSDSQPLRSLVGEVEVVADIDPNLLRQGKYLVSIAVGTTGWTNLLDVVYHFPAFEIAGHPKNGAFPLDQRWGALYLPFKWEMR